VGLLTAVLSARDARIDSLIDADIGEPARTDRRKSKVMGPIRYNGGRAFAACKFGLAGQIYKQRICAASVDAPKGQIATA
jgi:hypothetical protein